MTRLAAFINLIVAMLCAVGVGACLAKGNNGAALFALVALNTSAQLAYIQFKKGA